MQRFLDFSIAGFIIVMVAVIRYRNPDNLSWRGKQALFIYVAIILVILAGFLLVPMAHVIWLNFRYVAVALVLHPGLERLIHRIWEKRKKSQKSASPTAAVGGSGVKIVICLLGAMLSGALTTRAQDAGNLCQDRVAAVALQLKQRKGTCYFRDSKDAPWQKLSTADSGKKQFRAGQDLYCNKGCSIVIRLCGTSEKRTVDSPKVYRVLHAYSSPSWIMDRFQGIPARKSQLILPTFSPNDPSTQTASIVERLSAVGAIIGRIDGGGGRAAIGGPAGVAGGVPVRARSVRKRAQAKSSPQPTPVPPSPEEEQRQAEEKKLEALESAYTTLLAKGNLARHDKNYAASKQFYDDAVKLKPNDWRALYALANVYVDEGKWDEAEQTYRHALTLNGYSPEVYMALGFVLMRTSERGVNVDRLAQAETYLWEAASLDPSNERVYDLINTVLQKRGATEYEREHSYQRALRLYPFSVNTNLRLSELLRESGRRQEADSYLQNANKLASIPPEHLAVAEAFESQRQYRKAERSIRRALSSDGQNSRAKLLLGLVLLLRKHNSEAVQSLHTAGELNKADYAPPYLLAGC